jgi:hypothetical protein
MTKNKVAILISDGVEVGYSKAREEFESLMRKSYEVDTRQATPDIRSDVEWIQSKYDSGWKVLVMGRSITKSMAQISGTDVVDPEDLRKSEASRKKVKDKPPTTFEKTYLNKKPMHMKFDSYDYTILCMYHPLFVTASASQSYTAQWVSLIRDHVGIDPRENRVTSLTARTYKELYDYVIPLVGTQEIYISYDIESNYKFEYSPEFRIVGFSLSFKEAEGIYALMKSYDHSMKPDEIEKCHQLLKWLLSQKNVHVIVHNMMFELPSTLNQIGYEIPGERIEDTLVYSKFYNSGRTGGNGLKDQAVLHLGYSDWSKDLDHVGSIRSEVAEKGLSISRKSIKSSILDGSLVDEYKRSDEFNTMVDNVAVILEKYGYDREFSYRWLCYIVDQKILGYDERSFDMLPSELLSRYGSIDSIATRELFFYYRDTLIPEHSQKFKINSQEGYELWKESMYGAYKLELNSSSYDMSQVLVDRETMEEEQRVALSRILTSYRLEVVEYLEGRLRSEAVLNFFETGDNWNKYVESHKKFQGYTGTGKVRYLGKKNQKNKGTGITESVDGICNVDRDKVQELLDIFGITGNALNMHIKSYVRSFIDNIEKASLQKLQELLNPGSDAGKEILKKLMYNEMLGAAKFIIDMKAYYSTEACKIDIKNGRFNEGELRLLELINQYDKNKSAKERSDFFNSVLHLLSQVQLGSITASRIVECSKWRMATVDEENMTELYEYYYVTGIDADEDKDKDTEFRILFYTRYYKKIEKIITTYIDGGKLGVSQVYVVDKRQFEGGELFVPRLRKYEYGEKMKDNESLLYQGTWNPNSVLTGRWASPIHCLTGDTEVLIRDGRVGRSVSLESLHEECLSGEWIKPTTMSYKNGSHEYDTIKDVILSGRVDEIAEVYLSNGRVVRCTTDHRFLGYDGRDYRAYELVPGQRMMGIVADYEVSVDRVETVKLPEKIPVYDVVVDPENPYFALTAGIMSHNTLPADSNPKRHLITRFRGGCVAAPDFSQAELRVCGRAANDESLLGAYRAGIDVHLKTAQSIFGREEVTEVERRYSKMGCQSGETLIKLVNGQNYRVDELYSRWQAGERDMQVPSFCPEKGVTVGRVTDVQLTKYTKELCKVTFTDGTSVTMTPDHPLLLKGREDKYVEGKDSIGAEIEPWYKILCDKNPLSKVVASVEMLHLDEPVPVYDLSVAKYHNYVVDFDDGSGIFVHNTFQILYGGTPESFGMAFLNGEVELARKIFDGFFSAYPDVKKWMQDRYDEIQEKGYVTTMTSRAIYLGFESPMQNLEKIMRQAGNAPEIEVLA